MKPNALALHSLLCLLFLLVASCAGPLKQQHAFTPEEIVGTWQADYSRYELPDFHKIGKTVQGLESIVLKPNAVFQQDFQADDNLVSTGGNWEVQNGSVLHLKGGKYFVYGQGVAESIAQGTGKLHTVDCFGHETDIDVSELLLCIRVNRNAPGGIVLEHLEAGDPDAPQVVTFYRITP